MREASHPFRRSGRAVKTGSTPTCDYGAATSGPAYATHDTEPRRPALVPTFGGKRVRRVDSLTAPLPGCGR